MRDELMAGDTLSEIAVREESSSQRISQLVGPLNRPGTWKIEARAKARRERVSELVAAGKTDEQIASDVELTLESVRRIRLEQGTKRPNPRKKHSQESILACVRLWYETYHFTPVATDWAPWTAIKQGQPERAERFHEFQTRHGAPYANTAVKYFDGSWAEMIRRSGLPPARRVRRTRAQLKAARTSG